MNTAKTLPEAIHQSRPFESVQHEALLTLTWAHDRLSSRANRPICEAGLSRAQYNVLRILRGSPEGLQTHQVVERLVTRAPNMTRLVDKMETKGLIRRVRSEADRRVVQLRITPAGLHLLRELDLPVGEAMVAAMSGLEKSELELVITLLTKLTGNLQSSQFPHAQEVTES
jgi:DNA-binding MarR family transcriptional regulator